ncbi:DNA annealing helicase and endonuclease ZRANB3 [Engraulis encrasicolus]|uniref:DNA annealing helicase and endonuclease ZRANB3 n=1 Tax=Engraulis encrasicolus TaxID=184585 RepID=UPI002FD4DE96
MGKTNRTHIQSVPIEETLDQELASLPEKLQKKLMPFQRDGIKFALSRKGRCMIADEMGLGKTIQAISVASMYRHQWPLLIVVPSSLKYPWIEELERWLPDLQPGDINLVESKTDTKGISVSKVTVLGYGLLTTDARQLVEALNKQCFQVVVVDESHYLKSRNAARTKLLVPIIQNASRAILLTGTPALGRPEELFMQIDALYPKHFGTWSEYAKQYCNAHYRYFGARRQWDCRGASHLDELHQRLGQVMIRRQKAQVLTQLPPKVRQRIPFDLPKDQAKEASSSLEEWERLMRSAGSGASGVMGAGVPDNPFVEVMALITRMYKHTAVAKAGAVKDYIKMMLENEKLKFLVFAHHLVMLQACTEAVIEAKAGYIRIDGSVPSSERIQLVHRFQNEPETRVAVLSIQAAGQGLTFTAATHVVFAELYWNPGHVKQAEDRAHRIGQTCSVHVHYLIAKGTFDTVMWSMLNRKETVTGSTLNGKKEYLNAEVGDKDKFDFLNFAQAWSPSEATAAATNGPAHDKDEVFFSHFEKDKQHDIRAFFSPSSNKEKKRKRPGEDEETERKEEKDIKTGDDNDCICTTPLRPPPPSQDALHSNPPTTTTTTIITPTPSPPPTTDQDFAPQAKRLRQATPVSARGRGKRVSVGGKSSPLAALMMPPRRLSEGQVGVKQKWSCGACTYNNSGLLPYCEMCESPRPGHATVVGSSQTTTTSTPPESPPPSPQAASPSTAHPDSAMELATRSPHPPALSSLTSKADTPLRGDGEACAPQQENSGGDVPSRTSTDACEECVTDKSLLEVCVGGDGDGDGDGAGADESHPLYECLRFSASRHTDRIYIYDKDGSPLQSSFIPLDIKLDNWEELPPAFSRRENRRLVQRFVREWSSLTAMKQRLVRKSGEVFLSPALLIDQLSSSQRRLSSTKRYLTKQDVAQASLSKAQKEGGTVRVVSPENFFSKRKSITTTTITTTPPPPPPAPSSQDDSTSSNKDSNGHGKTTSSPDAAPDTGFLQAVDASGTPLCLSCQRPCVEDDASASAADDRRFCGRACEEDFRVRSSQSYMRARVLETEKGVCQQCGLDGHQLFQRVRDAPASQRKQILENTWLAQLPLKELNEMIRSPYEGQFWQVDHIKPVYGGGGQCSLDNLQTLCTVCHKGRTAQQARERSQTKRSEVAMKFSSDITRFFQKK